MSHKSPKSLTPEQLKKLQNKWYDKLEKSGFEDIEERHSPKEFLKRWAGQWFKRRTHVHNFEAKQEYFYQCGHFLTTHDFDTETERKVWQMHSEGLSLREIARSMRWKSHHKVRLVINKLKQEMADGYAATIPTYR